MPRIDFDAERDYDDDRFTAVGAFRSDRAKVICAYFEPGQFIPVHAPGSDLVVSIRAGTGRVRDGDTDHRVEPGDVIVVPADTERGIRADDGSRLEALVVTAPPPTDAEHELVRRGLRRGEFDPA
ncbi:cupin domain-containing protein [Haloplanus pelagicus]|jgi:quercetin dioxygenase-like cupin family protein|uniref:cupin domain-containing protein n=1 Tax=Haloplanus pelagicus TaxID=2949995 RepID=UPI00203F009B|nr:cupin domain-containing protein [Haloplanus sp. HW8-1]